MAYKKKETGTPRYLKAPVMITMYMEAHILHGLDRKAKALSKKHGFQVSRSAIIREICENYINVTGG